MNGFTPPPNLQPQNFEEFRRRMAGMNTAGSAIAQGADSLRAFMQNRARLDQGRYDSLLAAALKLRQMQALEKAHKEKTVKGPKAEKLDLNQRYHQFLAEGEKNGAIGGVIPGTTMKWQGSTDQQKAEAFASQILPEANAMLAMARQNPTLYDVGPLVTSLENVFQRVGKDYGTRLGNEASGADKAKMANELRGHLQWVRSSKGPDLPYMNSVMGGIVGGRNSTEVNKHASEFKQVLDGAPGCTTVELGDYGGYVNGKFVPFSPDYLSRMRADALSRVKPWAEKQVKDYPFYLKSENWNGTIPGMIQDAQNNWVPEELRGADIVGGMGADSSLNLRPSRQQRP